MIKRTFTPRKKVFAERTTEKGLEGAVGPKPLTITSFGCLQKTEVFYREK